MRAALALMAVLVPIEPSPAGAVERTLSAIDYLVDGVSLLDIPVHVTRCNLASANSIALSCWVYPPGNTKARVGVVTIDGGTLRREDLRKALNLCFDTGTKPDCWVDVTGTPYLRFPADKNPALKDAALEWAKP